MHASATLAKDFASGADHLRKLTPAFRLRARHLQLPGADA